MDGLFERLLRHRVDRSILSVAEVWDYVRAKVFNLQSLKGALAVAHTHYDIGNELYQAMLGELMVYSCGYWRNAQTLEEAQEAKLELVFRKLGLSPGMRVLDIGCGWGEALKMAAARYGVTAVGVTISEPQATYARQLCAGLPVDVRLEDYRKLEGTFDRILSIGMFEHVGQKNYRIFMDTVRRCLAPDGLFLLHTIGSVGHGHHADPWIEKYIFPHSALPSTRDIADAIEDRFIVEDWHNIGANYSPTLLAWRRNFEHSWPHLRDQRDQRFYRMWRYYLTVMAAAFRVRRTQVWQLVLSPEGVAGGYRRVC
jgi:cyclopropane-fatty-acyl-phospholipid synthase